MGLPGGNKGSACNVGDLGSITGLEKSLGGWYGNPLQYSCLENRVYPPWIEELDGLHSIR